MEKLAETEKSSVLLKSGMNRLRDHEAQMELKHKAMDEEIRKLKDLRAATQKKREEVLYCVSVALSRIHWDLMM